LAGVLIPPGSVHIRLKRIPYQSKKGRFMWECKARVISPGNRPFAVTSSDFGADRAANEALDRLSRLLRDTKSRKDKSLRWGRRRE
jgi:hypothetical protein